MNKDYLYRALVICILVFALLAIISVQFWSPTLYGPDGYLHIRMAKFIRDYGLKYNFHWARYSTFARNFADKDLLYHIALIPFVQFFQNDIFMGAKVSAIFFAVVFLVIFFLLLRLYTTKALVPLFLLALLVSDRFFYLFCWPRQMVMVIALTMLGIHFLIREKYWPACAIAFIYSLAHVSGPYMFFYALITEAVRYADNKKFNIKSPLFVFAGIAAAYLIHPNFPNNILVFYLNAVMVPLYSVKWGLELGAEFFPLSTRDYLLSYPFLVLSVILTVLAAVLLRPRASLRTKVFMAHACVFFVFSFLSQRYIAHGYPLILLGLASYSRDYLQVEPGSTQAAGPRRIFSILAALWVSLAIAFGMLTYNNLRQFALLHRVFDSHYEQAGKFLKENVPKGELIFHTNWSDSQYFIGLDPDNDYLVTLDPIYMFYYDRRLYQLYRDVSFGRSDDPYGIIKGTFRANYVYSGKSFFAAFIEQARKDARFQVLGEDNLGVIFRLK